MKAPKSQLQTAFTFEPTPFALEERHKQELAERDERISDLAAELQQLRDDLAFANLRLSELPAPEPIGKYETADEIELRVAVYFEILRSLIVPNVYYGMFAYEMDLVVLRPNGEVYEIEIKVSKSDLIADKKKRHKHGSRYVSRLYFAIPEKLAVNHCIEHIPERAGILLVSTTGEVRELRAPEINRAAVRFDDQMRIRLSRLGAIRIWNLKEIVLANKHQKKRNELAAAVSLADGERDRQRDAVIDAARRFHKAPRSNDQAQAIMDLGAHLEILDQLSAEQKTVNHERNETKNPVSRQRPDQHGEGLAGTSD